MKPTIKSTRSIKHKTRVLNRPQVMVAMKLQPLLPLCLEAIEECRSTGLLPSKKISIHSTVSLKNKLWLDATLFKEALVGLLEDSVKRFERGSKIIFSVSSTGMHCYRLIISYIHKATHNKSRDDWFEMQYYSSDRMREIVAQHQAAINLRKDGRKVTIELCFP
jgi:hypothetical protein